MSYKSLSFLAAYSDEINMLFYNNLNSSGFTYNLVLAKSPFYKYVIEQAEGEEEKEKEKKDKKKKWGGEISKRKEQEKSQY